MDFCLDHFQIPLDLAAAWSMELCSALPGCEFLMFNQFLAYLICTPHEWSEGLSWQTMLRVKLLASWEPNPYSKSAIKKRLTWELQGWDFIRGKQWQSRGPISSPIKFSRFFFHLQRHKEICIEHAYKKITRSILLHKKEKYRIRGMGGLHLGRLCSRGLACVIYPVGAAIQSLVNSLVLEITYKCIVECTCVDVLFQIFNCLQNSGNNNMNLLFSAIRSFSLSCSLISKSHFTNGAHSVNSILTAACRWGMKRGWQHNVRGDYHTQ